MAFPLLLLFQGLSVGLPLLNELFGWMTKAEKTFKGPGKGKKKKKFVVDAITKAAITAGAPPAETKKLAKEIGTAVDNAVTMSKMVNAMKK